MQLNRSTQADLFEELGLELTRGEVVVGETYPIFGMITKFVSDKIGDVVVEINFNIIAKINLTDDAALGTLKERLFESGIFISTVIAKEPVVEVSCQTVIFGRRQTHNA